MMSPDSDVPNRLMNGDVGGPWWPNVHMLPLEPNNNKKLFAFALLLALTIFHALTFILSAGIKSA